MADLEVRTRRTGGIRLQSGLPWEGLEVRYRERGVRRWSKFLVAVDDMAGGTIEDLERLAPELADRVHATKASAA